MNEILTALFTRLSTELTTPVFDYVPQGTDYPYVSIRVIQADNDDTDTEISNSVTISITGYSRYRGYKELMILADEITTALNNWQMVNTTSFAVGTFKEQFRQFLIDADNLTRYSVQEYIFYYEPL